MSKENQDYIYSENHLYSLACKLRNKLRDRAEETNNSKDGAHYLIGSYAESLYAPETIDDITTLIMCKAWRYAILLNESEDFPPEVKDAIKEKVKAFIDSYEAIVGKKGDE